MVGYSNSHLQAILMIL